MFKKYNSISNSYQVKEIMRWLNEYPELANETFVLEEKIDGANIQLYCEPGGKVQIGKRSSFITPDEPFYQLWEILKHSSYDHIMAWVREQADYYNSPVRLYGELYGPGVQKRINYDMEEQSLIFFDMVVGEHFFPPVNLHQMYDHVPLVPIHHVIKGLDNALAVSAEVQSKLSDDQAEGFVIKPYDKVYNNNLGSRFLLKSKSDKFNEKMKVEPKEKKALAPEILKAYNEFASYLTDNRIDNVIGNHGPFIETKQIGDYIRYVLDDMKKDFQADGFDEIKFDKDDLKQIYNVGHKIVMKLKERL